MEMIEIKITYDYMYQESIYVKKDELLLCNVVGSEDSVDDWDDYDDEEGNDGCCDDCGCYHGHHPWCGESDEMDDDW